MYKNRYELENPNGLKAEDNFQIFPQDKIISKYDSVANSIYSTLNEMRKKYPIEEYYHMSRFLIGLLIEYESSIKDEADKDSSKNIIE